MATSAGKRRHVCGRGDACWKGDRRTTTHVLGALPLEAALLVAGGLADLVQDAVLQEALRADGREQDLAHGVAGIDRCV
jgi:hypothetical protein